MPVRNKIRIYETAIWVSIVVCLGLCSLGAYLTYKQYRDMGVLLYASRKTVSRELADSLRLQIRNLEKETFKSLSSQDQEELLTLPPENKAPFFHMPFRILADGEIEGIGRTSLAGRRLAREIEPPPAEYRQAVRLSHSSAPLERKIKALKDASQRPSLSSAWQVRARTQLAALYKKHQRPAEAETIYSQILEAPASAMANLAWPTPEQISLARAETLAALNRGKAVPEVLSKGLAFLDSSPRKTGSYRREAYLQGSLRILQARGLEIPRELKDARKEIELLKPIAAAVKHVRDVSLPRELSSRTQPSSSPRWSLRGYRNNIAIAWKPAASASSSRMTRARGVVVDLGKMRQHLNQELASSADSGSLRVLMPSSASKEEMIPFASLGIEFPYISIGQAKAEWEEHLGAARRPFAIAGLLSGVLGLTLVGGLLILRRALRRELKLARMKTEFVANVSHELKTPLSLIKLCSETLQLNRLKSEEKRQEYFEVINRESDRLGHLIGNVLNFSRIDAGKKSYELKRADLAPLLNQTLDAYLLQLKEQDFTCRREIPSSLPAVMADEEAVAQAFINLLQNAVRYSPDKGEISVRGSSNGKSLLLSVTDTGIGIAQEDQEKIWDDYYRTAEARALGTRGSGLGLSLVSHIMEAHQGKILLTSTPGTGSEFTLVFPLANEKEMEPENGR